MKKVKMNFLWNDRRRRMGLPLSFTRYALTEDRLFLDTGFFNLRSEEILLYRVRDINLRRSLWQRIFGVGSIRVLSSDKSTPDLLIKNVKNPLEVKELLHRQVEETKISTSIPTRYRALTARTISTDRRARRMIFPKGGTAWTKNI